MRWPWQKQQEPTTETALERRATGSGFTAEVIGARAAYISGRSGIGELTATVQSCLSLWENGLSIADVDGTDVLTPRILAMMARSLGLRGEAVFLIGDRGLIAASDWELSTRDGEPRAYRLSISEAGGPRRATALAGEVVHVRLAADATAPWAGQAPLQRASITAEMLHAVEDALRDVYQNAPIGSSVLPFPEADGVDMEQLSRGFRGRRGSVLLRESVTVTAAGGPTPQADWRPADLSPDLSRSMSTETLAAAREAVCGVYGVLPGLMNAAATGPLIRECQRHLAQWTLAPITALIGQEVNEKLGVPVNLDVMRPTQSFDAGGRARALATIVEALVAAKEAQIDQAEIDTALKLIDWNDNAA